MTKYEHKKIEAKWQKKWAKDGIYKTEDGGKKPKCFVLDMFPYPSGEGLHVGHPKGYIATDIYSRYKKMNGFSVLHPMGWDAFGLPAENYAIKNKVHPKVAVSKNIKRFKEQLSKIGFNYNWKREINTTDPEYYRWTQWIFLQMFKKGLAYESYEPINWCPSCQTGLANEDLDGDRCERCDSKIERKPMRQWVLKITKYADRLLEDLADLPWPDSIKESQKNWIGRSEGVEINFKVKNTGDLIEVFTTRPDTVMGVAYLVLAPEHGMTAKLKKLCSNEKEIDEYIEKINLKSDIERGDLTKSKTGVELKGVKVVNTANGEELPVWTADYVLAHYGTGAVMAVPQHDERDRAFAMEFKLPFLDRPLISLDEAVAKTGGRKVVKYKLRDWVFSRQRYWGEPIPLVHCEKCGVVPVAEKDLPIKLPEVKSYAPTGTGESPLAGISKWVNTKCPKCGGEATRETNTMPQWAGSSWYYLRFIDPNNKKTLVDKKKEAYWSPVDVYVGGAEHATRHLIYARFWHKFLHDIGVVSHKEPFIRLYNVGLIMAEDGRKMSKRWKNVINPDDIIDSYGADTLRVYEMFMGPFSQSIAWKTENIIGSRRFLEKIWRLQFLVKRGAETSKEIEALLHETIKKVSEDIKSINFNTAISQMMVFANELEKSLTISDEVYKTFITILSPFAPHMAEEIWRDVLKKKKSVHLEKWPEYSEEKMKREEFQLIVQVNGKVRARILAPIGAKENLAKALATESPEIKKWIDGKEIKKIIFVENRLINFVI